LQQLISSVCVRVRFDMNTRIAMITASS
jgi:hypothetical protein